MNVSDLIDPDDPGRRTYRQVNAARTHAIPVGTLVELEDGVRLWVVHHDRDCDMTPLYYMSYRRDDTVQERPGFRNPGWTGGFPESALRIIATTPDTRGAS